MIGAFLGALLLAGQARGPIERAGGWTNYGPGGGFVKQLVIGPSSPATLYAATDVGVFKSTNGAESWVGISRELPSDVSSIAVDPQNSSRIYFSAADNVGRSYDYRSDDGGRTWTAMTPIVTCCFLLGIPVTALAVDPHASDTLYAGVSIPGLPTHDYPGASEIHRSVDRGQSWTTVLSVPGGAPTQILCDRGHSGRVFAVLVGRLFQSTDSGVTWNDVTPASVASVASLDQSPSDPLHLFALTSPDGVSRSLDGGQTWEPANGGLPSPSEVQFSSVAAAGGSVLYLGTDHGVFRSGDDGSSWHLQSPEPHRSLVVDPEGATTAYAHGVLENPQTSEGVSKSVDSGAIWTSVNEGLNALGITTVAADPRSPATVYAGVFRGVLRSLDSGKTWAEGVVGTDDFLNYPTEIAFDPFDSQTLYAASNEGLFESTDAGDRWELISASITGNDREISSVVASPSARGRLFVASEFGRVFRTDDAGANWVSIGPPQTDDQNDFNNLLAIDAVSEVLYLGSDQGIFRSVNSGITWLQTSIVEDAFALEVHPSVPNTVLAGTRAGLFRSTDAGLSWQPVASAPTAPDGPYVSAIAINPVRQSEIYITLTGLLGVYRSNDGGASWVPFNDGLALEPLTAGRVGALSINASGDRLYGAGSGVFSRPIAPSTRVLPPP